MSLKSWSGTANTLTDKEAEARDYAVMLLAENGYSLQRSYNPHNVRAWQIGNELGRLCIVVAGHEQEALDVAVDNGYMDAEKMADEDIEEYFAEHDDECGDPPDTFRAGNAGELFDSPYLWITPLEMLSEETTT